MNKYLFYILILSLALTVTLFGVYFLNSSSMNQNSMENSSQRNSQQTNSDSQTNPSELKVEPTLPLEMNNQVTIDDKTPKNYNNLDLIKIEEELNSLDLSSENDIE